MPKQQHFVILTSARTGSNLLYTMLHSHPDIYCDGEIFNHRDIKKMHKPWFVKAMRRWPATYVLFRAWRNTQRKSVYGFKLFPKQLDNNFEETINCLVRNKFKVIYLERRNKVSQVISFLLADQQNKWSVHTEQGKLEEKTTLNTTKLGFVANYFAEEWNRMHALKQQVSGLELVYEDDLLWPEQQETLMHTLAEYLSVPYHKLQVSLFKTDPRPDEERIRNLSEILHELTQLGYQEEVQYYKQCQLNLS